MTTQTFQFKTNIKCGGCISKVSPFLEELTGITHWEVNTADKNKILSVQIEGISVEKVIEKVKEAGFTIEPWNS